MMHTGRRATNDDESNCNMRFENKRFATGYTFLMALLLAGTMRAGDVLERRIQVSFSQAPLKTALDEVARLGGFEWSYNARILDNSRPVNLPPGNRTVRETLVLLLGDDYTFRQNGDNLILKRNKKPQQRLSGYLSDPHTGRKIPNATVYDRLTLRSTTTDSSGFYELPVGPRSEIVISKLDYRDTVLTVSSQTPRFVQLELSPDSLPHKSYFSIRRGVSEASYALEQFFVKTSQSLNALNVSDSLHRRYQISFLPGVGTNHHLSGSVTNDFSLNILAGYSRGNRALELAGLGNITRENMSGLQAAGAFNNLRGNASGVQAAGIYNYVGDTLTGVQASGVVNFAGYGTQFSVQAAGVLNLVPQGRFAMQMAGTANYADTILAFQAAGVWNHARALENGVQAAGVSNFAGRAHATAQFAGLSNSIGNGTVGLQVAGFANTADTLMAMQVSGFLNLARRLRGVQVGIVNIAGVNEGVQIGLLNFSGRGGYIALEASANDVLWSNLSFKSGRPGFYVTLTGGVDSFAVNEGSLWAFGAGIGSISRLGSRFGLNSDLTHRHLSVGSFDDAVQEWVQLAMGLDLRVAGGLHLFGGPTFNLLITDPADPSSAALRAQVVKKNLLPADAGDGWLAGGWGWTAGLRWRF